MMIHVIKSMDTGVGSGHGMSGVQSDDSKRREYIEDKYSLLQIANGERLSIARTWTFCGTVAQTDMLNVKGVVG